MKLRPRKNPRPPRGPRLTFARMMEFRSLISHDRPGFTGVEFRITRHRLNQLMASLPRYQVGQPNHVPYQPQQRH